MRLGWISAGVLAVIVALGESATRVRGGAKSFHHLSRLRLKVGSCARSACYAQKPNDQSFPLQLFDLSPEDIDRSDHRSLGRRQAINTGLMSFLAGSFASNAMAAQDAADSQLSLGDDSSRSGNARFERLILDVDDLEKDVQFWNLLGAKVTRKSPELAEVAYQTGFNIELRQRLDAIRESADDANIKKKKKQQKKDSKRPRTVIYHIQVEHPGWSESAADGRGEGNRIDPVAVRAEAQKLGGEIVYRAVNYDEILAPGEYLVKILGAAAPSSSSSSSPSPSPSPSPSSLPRFESVTLRCQSVPTALAFYSTVLDSKPSVVSPTSMLVKSKLKGFRPVVPTGSGVLGGGAKAGPGDVRLILQRYRTRVKPGPYPAIATVDGVKDGPFHSLVFSSPDVGRVRERLQAYEKGQLAFTTEQRIAYRLAIEQTVGAEEKLSAKTAPTSRIVQELRDGETAADLMAVADPDGHRIDIVQQK
eukprot:jgi/Bigna1/78329/fgenesh1_pg.54_\